MANYPETVKKANPQKKAIESTKEHPTTTPEVDIYETRDELVMIVDMPGVSKEDAQIKIDNGIITITGEAKSPSCGDIRYWEFSPCKYHRAFELSPEVDQEKIRADYKQGVLTIYMPKAERSKPRQIKVNMK